MSEFDSRNEKILKSIINGTEYTDPPQSRIEDLLLQLKEVIEHGGGGSTSILYGTSAPTAEQGSDGNLYVQYTEGTGGADDSVDALFVKLDDEWCEIETGGTANFSIIDTLWSGTGDTVGGTIPLSNPYTDYDLLVFKCYNSNGGMWQSSTWETDTIELTEPLMVSNLSIDRTIRRTILQFLSDTIIQLDNLDGANYVKEIIGIKLNGGVADYHEYSTNERIVGKWIDGKTLYEKTVEFEPFSISGGTTVAHGISDIDIVVDYNVFITRSDGTTIKFAWATVNNSSTTVSVTKTDIAFAGNDTWGTSNYTKLYATIRYTKASS